MREAISEVISSTASHREDFQKRSGSEGRDGSVKSCRGVGGKEGGELGRFPLPSAISLSFYNPASGGGRASSQGRRRLNSTSRLPPLSEGTKHFTRGGKQQNSKKEKKRGG